MDSLSIIIHISVLCLYFVGSHSQVYRIQSQSMPALQRTIVTGGLTRARAADSWAQHAADSVRPQVERQLGKVYDSFRVIEYSTQVVSGTNWYFKVAANGNSILLIYAHQPVGQNDLSLKTVRTTSDISTPLTDISANQLPQSGFSQNLQMPLQNRNSQRYVIPLVPGSKTEVRINV